VTELHDAIREVLDEYLGMVDPEEIDMDDLADNIMVAVGRVVQADKGGAMP
jgi:hypothetical protein